MTELWPLEYDGSDKCQFQVWPVGELRPAEPSQALQMRIYLPRYDLPGKEKLTSLSEEKGLGPLSQWAFIQFSLHRYT